MYLLDTNVVSEFRRLRSGRVEPALMDWLEGTSPAAMFLSVVSVHELEVGVRHVERRDPPAGRLLREWLDGGVLPAATAAEHRLTVATRNVRHFRRFPELAVFDPWTGELSPPA